MSREPEYYAHQEWIGYVQPVGLVVSIPALLAAQCYVNRNILEEHQRFLQSLATDLKDEPLPQIQSIRKFFEDVLGWQQGDLLAFDDNADRFHALEVVLPEYQEILRPTYVVPDCQPDDEKKPWLLLVQVLPTDVTLDRPTEHSHNQWAASPQAKFERLLRESEVPIGILTNSTHLRLVYAPRGESSGFIDFSVAEMMLVAGRPIFAALHMLLRSEQLFLCPENQRLPAILFQSRKYQNTVSNKLARQVLDSLYELLRGFQYADDQVQGRLLVDVLKKDPDHVYAGLLTVLMRLVFLLYAEDRDLISSNPIYTNFYSVSSLFVKLREDAARYPDTMDQRFGAWAQLLSVFRIIFSGARHNEFSVTARKGHLFDPSKYPFLEGAALGPNASNVPQISDGVVWRILENLLILDGEKLSYGTLDVEQIGSVYEAIMGFGLEVASGPSIAIKPQKAHGAPIIIDLQQLLSVKSTDRPKKFKEITAQELTGSASQSLRTASSIEELLVALEKKIERKATPNVVPLGKMILQPSEERRRTGSHYTPRSLTEPIVRTTLAPVIEKLGPDPTPEQILALTICDPAMGSGAFLVAVCRELADALTKAWRYHNSLPPIPPDEDEILHARRLVATRCLYGVDKNPMAVDLAKLSLWLATLAKEHSFTFLDHSLRCGDSLVGLTKEQIFRFHWQPKAQLAIDDRRIKKCLDAATNYRKQILENAENTFYAALEVSLQAADAALEPIRLIANAPVAAFFSSPTDKLRNQQRENVLPIVAQLLNNFRDGLLKIERHLGGAGIASTFFDLVETLNQKPKTIRPFHWQIEFPEVFDRANGGFDVIVGNPPFAGKNTLIDGNREGYLNWLKITHEDSHGNSDLVAHFFRRAFSLLRNGGTLGLIATNTIRQGDTRFTGLKWIVEHGGSIYAARRRLRWPGDAAVVVSVIYISKGVIPTTYLLDGRSVSIITSYLFHTGGNDNPSILKANESKSFIGSYVQGMGFTFDDTDKKGVASRIQDMNLLIEKNPKNAERIFPYIGGEELLDSPTQQNHRFVINFADFSEEQAWQYPDLMTIIQQRVRPERDKQKDNPDGRRLKQYWWQWSRYRPALFEKIKDMKRVLVLSRVGKQGAIDFQPANRIFSESLVVFSYDSFAAFAVLQSRTHEVWARFFGSTLEDRPRYTPTDCFESFPFPETFETSEVLENVGRSFWETRRQLMTELNVGLTDVYNAMHDYYQ